MDRKFKPHDTRIASHFMHNILTTIDACELLRCDAALAIHKHSNPLIYYVSLSMFDGPTL